MPTATITQTGLPGIGPDHCQVDMLAEHATHTGARVPLYDREALESRIAANAQHDHGQGVFDLAADYPVPEAWPMLAARQLSRDDILGLLPEDVITQYENALASIDHLKAAQEAARAIYGEPAYPFRHIATIRRNQQDPDPANPTFRAAILNHFGQGLDEIAGFVGASNENDLIDMVENIAQALRDARGSDSSLAKCREFARRVESGEILGYYPNKPKLAPRPIAGASHITSIAAAKRAARAIRAQSILNKAELKPAKGKGRREQAPRKPLMSAQEASSFGRFSVMNAVTVKHARPCGCEPYRDVFTFRRWLAMGMQVQRGEKAIKIPVIVHPDDDEDRKVYTTSAVFCRHQVKPVQERKTA